MKRKIFAWILVLLLTGINFGQTAASASESRISGKRHLNIATVDNRPIFMDRLIYAACKNIDYNLIVTTAASLQQGYTLANNGERDGVISSTPDMETLYPNLIKVPVVIEYNEINAYVRTDSGIKISGWSDLSGLKVGILSQRVYIQNSLPGDAEVFIKESTKLALEGLAAGEYDVFVYSKRAHETLGLTRNIMFGGCIEALPEYLYLHKSKEYLIRSLTDSLESLSKTGLGEKILSNMSVPEMYSKRTVIQIYSSDAELEREELLGAKLKEQFENEDSIEWYSVSLNSKRFSADPNRLTYIASLLRQDCVSRDVAAIIVSGNDAFEFLENYYFSLFINVPVLFYGIDEQNSNIMEEFKPYFSGIVEKLSAYETVSEAIKLFPKTTNLFIINDYSEEGKSYRDSIEKQLEPLAGRFIIEYNDDVNIDALHEQLENLPPDTLVFVGSYFLDGNSQYFSQNQMKKNLERSCKFPIIALYSTGVMYDSIGGKCLDYEKYGEIIADMLKRVLNEESAGSIPVVDNPDIYSRWVFDKPMLEKWGISEKSLPAGAEVINIKPSVWEDNPSFAYGMAALLAISVVVIVITQVYRYKNNVMQRKHNEQRKKYEEELRETARAAEESSRMKSVFLANMSHEIRTPMNGIIGFSELAMDDNISPETREYLSKIKSSSEGLLKIISDILDISKVEAGRVTIENIPFDIHDVFRTCQSIISPKALEKGIKLFCYAEPSVSKKLIGDPTKLRQVILNLLSNAVKFTNNGMVKLLSALEKTDKDSVTMRFEVKDSGIGITPEQLEKIFDPFMQADDSTTRKYGGTGLGLSIASNFVELMGGQISVESTPGVGSRFSFTLTFKTIDDTEEALNADKMADMLDKPVFTGEILICEDNSMNQQVLSEHLSRVGLRSVIAENGKIGVDLVAERIEKNEPPFDLIFMDIHMAVMDGLEAAENLMRLGCKSPIVALTANVMLNDREIYKAHGMPDYLAKPFTTQELWRCLLKYLTPEEFRASDKKVQEKTDAELQKRMLVNFVKDNQTTFEDIEGAVDAGDIKLGHRLAHTLKGVSGLIGETSLQKAAQDVEFALANETNNLTQSQLDLLKNELSAVLKDLAPLYEESVKRNKPGMFDKSKAVELLGKLEPLIMSSDTDCLEYIDEVAEVLPPVSEVDVLIEQIEKFDFKSAAKTFEKIKQSLEE